MNSSPALSAATLCSGHCIPAGSGLIVLLFFPNATTCAGGHVRILRREKWSILCWVQLFQKTAYLAVQLTLRDCFRLIQFVLRGTPKSKSGRSPKPVVACASRVHAIVIIRQEEERPVAKAGGSRFETEG